MPRCEAEDVGIAVGGEPIRLRRAGRRSEPRRLRRAGAKRASELVELAVVAADDGEHRARLEQRLDRLDQHVQPLQPVDPAEEEQQRRLRGDADRLPERARRRRVGRRRAAAAAAAAARSHPGDRRTARRDEPRAPSGRRAGPRRGASDARAPRRRRPSPAPAARSTPAASRAPTGRAASASPASRDTPPRSGRCGRRSRARRRSAATSTARRRTSPRGRYFFVRHASELLRFGSRRTRTPSSTSSRGVALRSSSSTSVVRTSTSWPRAASPEAKSLMTRGGPP